MQIAILLSVAIATNGLIPIQSGTKTITLEQRQRQCRQYPLYAAIDGGHKKTNDGDNNNIIAIPTDIACDVRSIAETLWDNGPEGSLGAVMMAHGHDNASDASIITCNQLRQGEMPLPKSVPFSQRFPYFIERARKGDPRAQHSIGLLLWNGFAASSEAATMDDDASRIDPEASARWHAAAAVQGNIDAVAVLGGCLRTGTGVGKCKNISLGLRCIEYAASMGNPSGVNKKAAMMESNDDYIGAMRLYRECYDNEAKRKNALLLFNLGYCLVHHGDGGVNRNAEDGEQLWRDAVKLAPEEGSEEAAWFLYQQYAARDDEKMAREFLNAAADLGHQDAEIERRGGKM
ncbi:hypothetical protein ACHAXR_011813 [Thalassiosira sp. AJA248-18]